MRCNSRAHLKAWSNQPSWKISLSTQKTNPTSPLVGLPEAQKLGCRLGTSPRAGSKTAKSTGKLGSFVFLCFCVCVHTQTQTHKHTQTDPYFCVGRSEKRQVPRTSPRVVVFVCLCVFVCTQKHTNTQTDPYFCVGRSEKRQVPRTSPRVVVFVCLLCVCAHKNTQTQTHKRTPISVWVGRENAKSPGRAPELLCLCVCVCVHTQTHKHKHTNTQTDPYFCVGRSEKRQVPRTSPRVDVFVCLFVCLFVCVCLCAHKNTQKHTNTHKRTPISRTSC